MNKKTQQYTPLKQLFKEKYDLEIHPQTNYTVALTHSSYVNENRKQHLEHNERLEFLGDAVVEVIVSKFLYETYPDKPEGDLSRMRALAVCEDSLSEECRECGFNRYLKLGKGEENSGGRTRNALLCDLFEAVVGALYLDLGLEGATQFLEKTLYPKIKSGQFEKILDCKTALQEELQKNGKIQLHYQIVNESGPAHDRRFTVEAQLDHEVIGQGIGKSKKAAEQAAAKDALIRMNKYNEENR